MTEPFVLIPLSSTRPEKAGKYLLLTSSIYPSHASVLKSLSESLTNCGNEGPPALSLALFPSLSAGRRRNHSNYSPSLAPHP